MKLKLKVVFTLGTFFIAVVLAILYRAVLKQDGTRRIIIQNRTRSDIKEAKKSAPGSWFAAVDESLSAVDNLFDSLLKHRTSNCLHECENSEDILYKERYSFFEEDSSMYREPLLTWLKNSSVVSLCDSKLKVFDRKFALLQNVTLHAFKWDVGNFARGGEELAKFKNRFDQSDAKEILSPKAGLFTMSCSWHEQLDEFSMEILTMLQYLTFTKEPNNKVTRQESNVSISIPKRPASETDIVSNFTIAIAREDYANIYHMSLHMFSVFLMLKAFRQQPRNITLLILDAHPAAEIDSVFQTLYGPLIRIGQLKRPTFFNNLVFSLPENKSPLSKYKFKDTPYLDQFRSFVLNRYLIGESSVLNCKELKITLVWRRDKVYHPRNMKGTVHRKIFNEAEIYSALYEKYPHFCIRGFLFETLPMSEQLKIIKNTDVLIGMHGAGLIHTLYLPNTAGLIELFPYKFKKMYGYYNLFGSIAEWRQLHYTSWENTDEKQELSNYFTNVNVVEVMKLVDDMINNMCP